MKTLRLVFILCTLVIGVMACSDTTPTSDQESPLPTPDVPPLAEIDSAIERWENSQTSRYFLELDENTQERHWMVRLLVADGIIRTAQRMEMEADGKWGDPTTLTSEQAQSYTVDAILARVRKDIMGNGPVPFNIKALFDDSLGYPTAVHAESLPAYNEDGNLILDRQYSYDLTMQLKPLLEDTFKTSMDPILILINSGGPQASCDTLRIFSDGSAAYTDDCRNEAFQLTLPASRKVALEDLRSSFASLDDLRGGKDESQRLIILGSGEGTPDAATVDAAWALASEIHEIVAEPIGLGLTMVYLTNGELFGFDVLNQTIIPTDLSSNGDLRGALLSSDGSVLAFSDNNALSALDMKNGKTISLLDHPESGYYLPRAWSGATYLMVTKIPSMDGQVWKHGWISYGENVWRELPLPDEVPGYGCDTGSAWSPISTQLVITGLDFGGPCNTSPGVTLIDIQSGIAQRIVAPPIETGDENGTAIIAGAHTPAWSPDGTWIAFGLDQDALAPLLFPTRLYRVNPDGSDLTPLTNNSQGFAAYPIWGSDGSLYYSLSGDSVETDGIYHYIPAENRHDLIIPGSNIFPLSISTDTEFLAYIEENMLRIWSFRLGEVYGEVSGEDDLPPTFVGWLSIGE